MSSVSLNSSMIYKNMSIVKSKPIKDDDYQRMGAKPIKDDDYQRMGIIPIHR